MAIITKAHPQASMVVRRVVAMVVNRSRLHQVKAFNNREATQGSITVMEVMEDTEGLTKDMAEEGILGKITITAEGMEEVPTRAGNSNGERSSVCI